MEDLIESLIKRMKSMEEVNKSVSAHLFEVGIEILDWYEIHCYELGFVEELHEISKLRELFLKSKPKGIF